MRILPLETTLAALLSYASGSFGDELNYEYVQFDMAVIDLDTRERGLNGTKYHVEYSREILDTFYLSAGLSQNNYDNVVFYDIVQNDVSAGLGMHHSFSWRLDLYGEVAYAATFTDLAEGDQTDHGFTGKLGLRTLPIESIEEFELEFAGGFDSKRESISGENNVAFGIVNARWNFNEWLSVSIGSKSSSNYQIWRGSLRLSF